MPWNRDTPWRQGHQLDDAAVEALGIRASVEEGTEVAIVISHDCDLAADCDKEPELEVMVAKRIEAIDGNLSRAKNPRVLHLEAQADGASEFFELRAQRKLSVSKEALADFAPRPVLMSPEARAALQTWLAARYRRSAFPNAFEHRLREHGVDKAIVKVVKKSSDLFVAVLADLDHGAEVERVEEEDMYDLGLVVLYDGDAAGAREAAEDAVASLENVFEEKCRVDGTWKGVKLSYCDAISDEVMTVAMQAVLRPLYLDYMSVDEQ